MNNERRRGFMNLYSCSEYKSFKIHISKPPPFPSKPLSLSLWFHHVKIYIQFSVPPPPKRVGFCIPANSPPLSFEVKKEERDLKFKKKIFLFSSEFFK